MITLNYVIYDCIANICLLLFAALVFKKSRYAWLMVIFSLIIKIFLYSKYSMLTSFIYLSAQLFAVLLASIVWLKVPDYTKPTKQKRIFGLLFSVVVIIIWVGLMYKYINPAILDYDFLFGFEYLCYMLFTVGAIFVAFRLAIGLLVMAVVLISYAVNYANSAVMIDGAPQYIHDFVPYYWVSATVLFVAGIILVASYTNAKRSY